MALTVEELYKKWDRGITKIALDSGIPSRDIEDVKQQIYLEFHRGQVFAWCPRCKKEYGCPNDEYDELLILNREREARGEIAVAFQFYCKECAKNHLKIPLENIHRLSYSEIFDERKGAESTFVYHFVSRRCMQFISRTYRDPLRLSNKATNEDGDDLDLMDIIPTKSDIPREIDLTMAIGKLRDKLDGIPIKSMVEELNVERSLRKVFEYMEKGYRQRQIAARLNYSEASVSLMVKEIRKLAGDLGLREVMIEE